MSEVRSNIEVSACGGVRPGEIRRAEQTIGRVLRRHAVAGGARIRLTARGFADGETIAQVNVNFGGQPVRTQIAGPGVFALTFAAERLDRQLARLAALAPPRWAPDPGRTPLAYVSDERPIVRRENCEPRRCDPVAAARVMDALDYDAHLFTDIGSGEDAVVYWAGPLGVRMARQRRMHPPRNADELRLTMNPHPTRILTESGAVARLCTYGLSFLFFTAPDDGRGRLLYRRYDGDLGLVAAKPSAPIQVE
ncbi:hypothetical protein GFY24_09240 [Nocardia sp. SYP-A9097]|nr:hypothetical protein [Nocardia sp. SYP-A9097]